MSIEIKQMKLMDFCECFGFSRSTVLRLIFDENLPAYKIGGLWYIDIEKYKKWREKY